MWLASWLRKRKTAAESNTAEVRIRILAISVFLNDRVTLEQLGKREGWELKFTNSPRDAFRLVTERHFEVILCDRNQYGYPWREVMERLAQHSPHSRILLVSPVTGDYLWRDVVQQGGHDILPRPLREWDELPVIRAAAGVVAALAGSDSRRVTADTPVRR